MKNRFQEKWEEHHKGTAFPNLPWIMKQTWHDLLFAHYPVKLELLQKLVPPVFQLDSYNGIGWVGVVPFHVQNHRVRLLPPIPGFDRFAQINIRTYVTVNGKRGVYFIRVHMNHLIAGVLAKTFYYMPFQAAIVKMEQSDRYINFCSIKSKQIEFQCHYTPISESKLAEKASFEHWLVERYSMYSLNRKGEVMRSDILHNYWPLQLAEGEITNHSILLNEGIQVANNEPILHYAKKMEAMLWPVVRENGGKTGME